MADSTLGTGEESPVIHPGHGTRSLGPSATDQKITITPGIESAADEFDDPEATPDDVENYRDPGMPAADGAT